MIPVTVVTGFLGAGKTTLVNRWLGEVAKGDIAVIVNEHGAIGVDAELLAARVEMLVEIAGGCVCCSTQAELVRALGRIAKSGPKRILVETSGAASPAGVIRAVRGDDVRLDGIVTVVDGRKSDIDQDLAIEQIGYADIVVLSRADAAKAAVAAINPAAVIGDYAPLAELLARRTADFVKAPTSARHDAYESVALHLDGAVDGERFADFMENELARFASRLFRVKGILAVDDMPERMIVQGVADEVEVTFGEAWADTPRTSRLVVIGFGLDKAALERAFRAASQTRSQ